MAKRCKAGDWVEIEVVVLEPGERSPNVPEETAGKPLLMWVKGFAKNGAAVGREVEVETMSGRAVSGRLSAVRPAYTHSFGEPPAELVSIGRDLRARLSALPGDGD